LSGISSIHISAKLGLSKLLSDNTILCPSTGISIFIFGNKLKDGSIVLADGVRKEFEIAKQLNTKLVPIGATGLMAEELYNEMIANFSKFYEDRYLDSFTKLGDKSLSHDELIKVTIQFINQILPSDGK